MKIYRAVKAFEDIKDSELVYVQPMISPRNDIFYVLRLRNKQNFRGDPSWYMEIDKNALDTFFQRVIE